MGRVIPFNRRTSDEDHEKQLAEQLRKMEEIGSHAWGKLKPMRRFKDKKDRIAMAKELHAEIEKLKRTHPKIKVGELAREAKLSQEPTSKELWRLTLPSGVDPAGRGLRADPQKYVRLIEAIQRLTGENISLLADRVTWATSFHPKQLNGVGVEESEHLIDTLQEAINRIDSEFREISGGLTLYETFMKTAQLKVEMVKKGSPLRWPICDNEDGYYEKEPPRIETVTDSGDTQLIDNPLYPFTPRQEDDLEVKYAYWQRDALRPYYQLSEGFTYPSSLSHHFALMHLPRIYLGVAEDWESWFGHSDYSKEDVDAMREMLKHHVGELSEIRDKETGDATIAHRHPETGEWKEGLEGEYSGIYPIHSSAHVWLVIYPTPDNRSLGAMLYRPYDEGGTHITFLNHRAFLKLRDYEYIGHAVSMSLYDRINELMGDTGKFEIYEEWKKTAQDILRNPIWRAHMETVRKKQERDKVLEDFWNTGKK